MRTLNGEPLIIPPDWVTVFISHLEITEAADMRHGIQNMDHVVLHLLRDRGVRVILPTETKSDFAGTPIESPHFVISDHEGITVHQGPRVGTC